jgi:hypothetical protein
MSVSSLMGVTPVMSVSSLMSPIRYADYVS